MNREDFLILKSGIIYFDNGATSLKPQILSETISDYYNNYSSNVHRGGYDIGTKTDTLFSKCRDEIKKFINAKKASEIIYTSGTTDSINKLVFGYFKKNLKEGDEVLITVTEHASNVLPWFELEDQIKIKVKYIPLNNQNEVTLDNVKKTLNKNTKVISLAHTTNVIGDTRPIKEITELAHKNNILVMIDGAQSIPHMKIDVQEMDVDFYTFSAHKMLGPTGLGIIYGKKDLLTNIDPIIFGGGMNETFGHTKIRIYKDLPYLLEAGTPPIASVLGFLKIIEYLNKVDINKIEKYTKKIREYALDKIRKIEGIELYNEFNEGTIITFNIKGYTSNEVADYLNKFKICVRSGSHCAKMLNELSNINATVRLSFYFYNTLEEIDFFIEVLKNINNYKEII